MFVEPFLTIGPATSDDENDDKNVKQHNGVNIYFQEDWSQGLGGGLWSTGLAFAKYFATPHGRSSLEAIYAAKTQHQQQQQQQQSNAAPKVSTVKSELSVLELGSGNGLLSICLLALAKTIFIDEADKFCLACTDLASHLPMIQKTLDANRHILNEPQSPNVRVFEHVWGSFLDDSSVSAPSQELSFQHCVQRGQYKFDMIVGSDVAYHTDLYDVLIKSLIQYSDEHTVILIGVTMTDTKPTFFSKLRMSGFTYQKMSDHLVSKEFRGSTFGIFVIRRRQRTAY